MKQVSLCDENEMVKGSIKAVTYPWLPPNAVLTKSVLLTTLYDASRHGWRSLLLRVICTFFYPYQKKNVLLQFERRKKYIEINGNWLYRWQCPCGYCERKVRATRATILPNGKAAGRQASCRQQVPQKDKPPSGKGASARQELTTGISDDARWQTLWVERPNIPTVVGPARPMSGGRLIEADGDVGSRLMIETAACGRTEPGLWGCRFIFLNIKRDTPKWRNSFLYRYL